MFTIIQIITYIMSRTYVQDSRSGTSSFNLLHGNSMFKVRHIFSDLNADFDINELLQVQSSPFLLPECHAHLDLTAN
jgi:hypothetical protein